jgi:hypothetical protein
MNKLFQIKTIVLGILALVVLYGLVYEMKKHSAPKPELTHASNSNSPLYDPGDKPMTVLIREEEADSGRLLNIGVKIRESKTRYNQMKQTVLAFLQGPRSGSMQVPVPEGLALNEFYFTPQGTAVVDLSTAQLKQENFGFYEESIFIHGIMDALTKNFFEVKQVKILVDGQDPPTLAGHYALGTSDTAMPVSAAASNGPNH